MTTDPVIAEITRTATIPGPNGGEAEGEQDFDVYLSESPKTEELLDAAKNTLLELSAAALITLQETTGAPARLFNAIRAIDSEWTP